jgi:hypothetical protein
LGALFGLPNPKTQRGFGVLTPNSFGGLYFYSFKIVADQTPKPAERFGGLTPNPRGKQRIFGGFWVLGVNSPIIGSWLAKTLFLVQSIFINDIESKTNINGKYV